MDSRRTSSPPPTPSSQSNIRPTAAATASCDAADELARLLRRIPPSLSLLTTCRAPPPAAGLPSVSLSDGVDPSFLSAATELGFFQLKEQELVPPGLAESALSNSISLFQLSEDQRESCFPKSFPLGYSHDEVSETRSVCLEFNRSKDSFESTLGSLREFSRALEKVGLQVVDKLAAAIGFKSPIGEDLTRFRTLTWVYEGMQGDDTCSPVFSYGFYPCVVGLVYQMRSQKKQALLTDSGWVTVSPRVDSVLVTVGDIAQVWSNGKLKKVRGRPVACSGEGDDSHGVTMTVILTLPMDAEVSPQLPNKVIENPNENEEEEEEKKGEKWLFRPFSFEDYAWRVYHERLLFRDPLDKYRVGS